MQSYPLLAAWNVMCSGHGNTDHIRLYGLQIGLHPKTYLQNKHKHTLNFYIYIYCILNCWNCESYSKRPCFLDGPIARWFFKWKYKWYQTIFLCQVECHLCHYQPLPVLLGQSAHAAGEVQHKGCCEVKACTGDWKPRWWEWLYFGELGIYACIKVLI